jgi:predicted Zn-dependent protease
LILPVSRIDTVSEIPIEDVDWAVWAADSLAAQGQLDEHVELLRDAMRLHPDEPQLMLRLALAIVEKAPGEADELVRRSLEVGVHDDPEALYRAVSVLYRLGKDDETLRVANEIIALAPQGFRFSIDLEHLVGRMLVRRGLLAEAEPRLRSSFELDPSSHGFGVRLAEMLLQSGRPNDAAEVVAQALVHRPEDSELLRLRTQLQSDHA